MYRITNELPTASEFVQLRVDCGLSFRDVGIAAKALQKSDYFIGLRDNDTNALIGMGRIVGDGIMFIVSDVAVHPTQ